MGAIDNARVLGDCAYRIPVGVEFRRWDGGDDWVVYHCGSGEPLRLSEGAIAILDILAREGPKDSRALAAALAALMDDPPALESVGEAAVDLLSVLLKHECIETVRCA